MSDNKAIIAAVKDDPMVIQAMNNLNEVKAIQQTVFQKGVHYGAPYKGSKNDTLLKPGATFLQQKFQLREQHERLETTIVVNPDDLSKSYIIIQNRCRIFNIDGVEVAQADAACTTFEDKYLYRQGTKICPVCGGEFIIKGKVEYGGGWLCYKAKGGCGAKFKDDDPAIIDQDTEKKLNANPLNMLDTIIAMAQKRASVRATIKATGIDALFSPGDGVTVDYYDDLEQTNDDLISVVDKNATQSNEKGTPSDLSAPNHADAAATAKSRFAGNGPDERTIAPKTNGKAGYKDGELFNAVLKTVYGNNPIHMKNSLKKLTEEGKLGPWLTLDEAIEIVKTRHDADELPEAG